MWNQSEEPKENKGNQHKTNIYTCGMDPEKLQEEVYGRFIHNDALSMTEKKAQAIAYIMENARIGICSDDFFADHIDHAYVMTQVRGENAEPVLAATSVKFGGLVEKTCKINAFRAEMDYGHIGPDWEFLIRSGIPGVLKRLREHRALHLGDKEKEAYYDAGICVYEAFCGLMLRMAQLAETCGTEKMDFLAGNLRQLTESEPKTLAQAMELTLLVYAMLSGADSITVRSLGSLDRLYGPLYRADLESGRFTQAQLRELTRAFFLHLNAKHVVANVPFSICGKDGSGQDASNEYTRVLLQEYRALDICDPKMHVLYHRGMPSDILTEILDMIRSGNSSFVFISVDAAVAALEKIGIAPEDAERLTVYGCYETAAEGTELPATCAGKVNLAKAVELAMNNGVDPMTGIQFGPQTGTDFETFEAFSEAVRQQLAFAAESCMELLKEYDHHFHAVCPAPMISATYENSVRTGVDIYAGGAKYNNTSVVGAGIATLIDSLMAVKKAVFEDRKISFRDFRDCLNRDWEGQEDLLLYCRNLPEKYGNNHPEADSVAVEFFRFFAGLINGRKNSRGGVFRCGLFSVDWRMWMGATMGATPDGRRRAEPISKNTAAVLGQDRQGVTALLGSQLKLDGTQLPDGMVADVVLHSSAVKGDDGLAAFTGLVTAYLNAGGFAIHLNVLDEKVLLKAQQEPEKYRNLQIRLCGWNVYFVDLSKQEQDEFILQAANRS